MSNKLREVLRKADIVLSQTSHGYNSPVRQEIKSALADPLRNCDVGNEHEQNERFVKFCRKHEKGCGLGWGSKGVGHPKVTCPAYKCLDCGLVWGQMPYEKEGEE